MQSVGSCKRDTPLLTTAVFATLEKTFPLGGDFLYQKLPNAKKTAIDYLTSSPYRIPRRYLLTAMTISAAGTPNANG